MKHHVTKILDESGTAWNYHATGRWSIAINGRVIEPDVTITQRRSKNPRYAHIPVYVLRKP
jgi:hypothetical protein